jgi:hypothetical protein
VCSLREREKEKDAVKVPVVARRGAPDETRRIAQRTTRPEFNDSTIKTFTGPHNRC